MELREYRREDALIIASWIKSEEQRLLWSAFQYAQFPILPEEINNYYLNDNGDCHQGCFFPLTFEENGVVVGHLILKYVDEDHHTMRMGYIIVDNDIRGKGYGREIMKKAMEYAVSNLGANKFTLGVYKRNTPAYNLYKSLGFSQYGEDGIYFMNGEYWSFVNMELAI